MMITIPANYDQWNKQLLEATAKTRFIYTLFPHTGRVSLIDTQTRKNHFFDSVDKAVEFINGGN